MSDEGRRSSTKVEKLAGVGHVRNDHFRRLEDTRTLLILMSQGLERLKNTYGCSLIIAEEDGRRFGPQHATRGKQASSL